MIQEKLATKIKCQWCHREIWIPGPLAQNPSRHTYYCCYCGCYTKVNGEKAKLDDEEFRDKHRD